MTEYILNNFLYSKGVHTYGVCAILNSVVATDALSCTGITMDEENNAQHVISAGIGARKGIRPLKIVL